MFELPGSQLHHPRSWSKTHTHPTKTFQILSYPYLDDFTLLRTSPFQADDQESH